MKLLVSVVNEEEAREALAGGADIIDVKNPLEGSLGANFPKVIRRVVELSFGFEVSAAIGDMPNLPGTASLAALGAASYGVDYIKIGLMGPQNAGEAIYLMQRITETVREANSRTRVIAVAYADARRVGSLDPLLLPQVALAAGADGCMLDTAVKDGSSLFDFLDLDTLRKFVREVHDQGFLCALAGSLKAEDLSLVWELGADIAGVRGAACIGDRREARVAREKILSLSSCVPRRR
ncbi:(5-formylfuran-3-yl)methyl phosphate synthase [Candidatus Hakubella thermalkaliphila]|uniref:(5-formylfuran-3-yl)methyl phosphate synthase n=1 Tax=Candidatus Hakubella thermalkaliphila TaxID=2754717 RepID=A0A6V8PFI8_9ACTN|nr:(5-formylfuran-3-yl)methyl phosphate synthase [Candidatus Hakubella thermalkaliphila]GFP30444.1 (5-formylfuran-3-yl)methyl phosphate synthase [Candidatus Hakubella thermalkaliphila]GFP39444.1 (5-formylfuran-3-yl)methyl phosphate synthase [Candidatus Hakubella thermalkaliphila]GFP43070.1 (5-formylfuran-3-yl)methyl phosphate synthase [Candidatus Hakubella thermalkaliphila]